jgi:hypothetical protein
MDRKPLLAANSWYFHHNGGATVTPCRRKGYQLKKEWSQNYLKQGEVVVKM